MCLLSALSLLRAVSSMEIDGGDGVADDANFWCPLWSLARRLGETAFMIVDPIVDPIFRYLLLSVLPWLSPSGELSGVESALGRACVCLRVFVSASSSWPVIVSCTLSLVQPSCVSFRRREPRFRPVLPGTALNKGDSALASNPLSSRLTALRRFELRLLLFFLLIFKSFFTWNIVPNRVLTNHNVFFLNGQFLSTNHVQSFLIAINSTKGRHLLF